MTAGSAGYPAYQYGLSIASGCELGGGMAWNVTDMGDPPACARCGAPRVKALREIG